MKLMSATWMLDNSCDVTKQPAFMGFWNEIFSAFNGENEVDIDLSISVSHGGDEWVVCMGSLLRSGDVLSVLATPRADAQGYL